MGLMKESNELYKGGVICAWDCKGLIGTGAMCGVLSAI